MKSNLMLKIEEVRGVIKNQYKYQPMIDDIEKYASSAWIDECLLKRFGLNFIWEVVTVLPKIEQSELMIRLNSKYQKINIHNAKYEYIKLKKELGE